ncbi:MAG: hypothetical protein AAGF97_00340 [Planctomycetota bacterium]
MNKPRSEVQHEPEVQHENKPSTPKAAVRRRLLNMIVANEARRNRGR